MMFLFFAPWRRAKCNRFQMELVGKKLAEAMRKVMNSPSRMIPY